MKKITLTQSMIPVVGLILLLAFNVLIAYGDNALSGSNQFMLLVGAAIAAVVGFVNKVPYRTILDSIAENVKSTSSAILILLFVGALSGTWLISGVIPSMIYYGLDLLNPTIFLFASVIISAIISIATGSSWTTSATIGIVLVGIGKAIGLDSGMVAGAVISGAYFGDKMSPMSDTTNLSAVMAGTDLFTHIKYMAYTTIPSISIALLIFLCLGFFLEPEGIADPKDMQSAIRSTFHITPWLLLVPLVVIILIVMKTKPLVALFIGTLVGGLFTMLFQADIIYGNGMKYHVKAEVPIQYSDLISNDFSDYNYVNPGKYKIESNDQSILAKMQFQLPTYSGKNPEIIKKKASIFQNNQKVGEIRITAEPTSFFMSSYFAIMDAITIDVAVETSNQELNNLFTAGGMKGMLSTIWLIICAMVFGGAMEAIGALKRITEFFLSFANSIFGLYASTVVTCLGLNVTASDQYLSIVVPGKMFKKAYDDKGLAPENLSRTLEDSGTVTSVLVPWNTCGAYQAGVLGVQTTDYLFYAVFNYLSPFMTLLFVALKIKIRMVGGSFLK